MTQKAHWDGEAIIGWITYDGVAKKVSADRQTIHLHAPGYSDAISWELKRFAEDIFAKLTPYFESKFAGQAT